jgi:outer membrane protein OmpA-like peptidoglycan-associated protein
MTRNHFVVALAAVGFAGLTGCGHAVEVPVAVAPPPIPVVVAEPAPPPPPAPRLVTVCDAAIAHAGHLKFPHEVEFDIGKATIKHTPTTDAILKCLVDFLGTNKMVTKFRVDGHTDNAGDATANMTLSQARADAIVAWMSSNGVESGKLQAKGWGPTKPIAPNDNPEHMAQNRRVEFWIEEINGVHASTEVVAAAMNPPAPTGVVTTAVAVPTVGVAVPTVGVAVPGVAVTAPAVGVAVPGVAVGVTAVPGGKPKKP